MKIVLSANSSWNIYNFRLNIIKKLLIKHKVIILAPQDEYTDKLVKLGCIFHNIEIDSHGISAYKDLGLTINYFFKLKKIKPDYFISFTIKPNIYGSFCANILSIKVINNISGLGTVFINKGILLFISKILYKFSLRRSDKVIFHNKADESLFIKMNIINKNKSEVIPGSGVDLSLYKFKKLVEKPKDKLSFLFIGRYIIEKGIIEYIEAATLVKKKFPNITFKTVGFFEFSNKSSIDKNLLNSYKEQNIIEILESKDDIISYIEQSDCVILPSYREGMPRSLLESSAIGRPLIAADVPGCNSLIKEDFNGHLCRVKDSLDLSKAIIKHINLSYEKRCSISQNAFDNVRKFYDEKFVINKFISIIEEKDE